MPPSQRCIYLIRGVHAVSVLLGSVWLYDYNVTKTLPRYSEMHFFRDLFYHPIRGYGVLISVNRPQAAGFEGIGFFIRVCKATVTVGTPALSAGRQSPRHALSE